MYPDGEAGGFIVAGADSFESQDATARERNAATET